MRVGLQGRSNAVGVPNGASLADTLSVASTCGTGMTIQVTAAIRTTALRDHGSRSGEKIPFAPGYLFGVRKRHSSVSPELRPELRGRFLCWEES